MPVLTFDEDVLPWVCCCEGQHAWQAVRTGQEIGDSEDANAYLPLFAVGGTSAPLTDRFSLWLLRAQMLGAVPVNNVSIDLKIYQGGMTAASLRWSGSVVLTAAASNAQTADTAGWIVQLRGLLGETWYVYGRITPNSLPGGAPTSAKLTTSWRMYGDRIGGGAPGADVPAP